MKARYSKNRVTSGFNTWLCVLEEALAKYFLAPVSFLICFYAAWAKFPPLKGGPSAGRQRGKKSISSPGFQAEITANITALNYSHHIIPNSRFSEIFRVGLRGREL